MENKCSFYRERNVSGRITGYCILENRQSPTCESCVGDKFMDESEVAYVLKEREDAEKS